MKYLLVISISIFISIGAHAQKKEFYNQINSYRVELGLRPLQRSVFLEVTSKSWLRRLRDLKKVRHDIHTKNAEVICEGVDPVRGFMNSAPHRNILMDKNLKKIGVAYRGNRVCARLN
jgi:uncharacterized protein YkwD